VDLSLFKGRKFWRMYAMSLYTTFFFFGNVWLLPLWLQQWMGYTPPRKPVPFLRR
jgi:DHA2 family multidrug resistance protein